MVWDTDFGLSFRRLKSRNEISQEKVSSKMFFCFEYRYLGRTNAVSQCHAAASWAAREKHVRTVTISQRNQANALIKYS